MLINRPLTEIQYKSTELARDKVEAIFPNWFAYLKHGNHFIRCVETRYADNDANRQLGYCAAEKAVWVAASLSDTTARDLLLVWNLTIIEHQMSISIDATLDRCYKNLETLTDATNVDTDKPSQIPIRILKILYENSNLG